MYLSRLLLNPRLRRVQKEQAAPYEFHRTLMRGFPERLPADERVLYRIDVEPDTGVVVVLVQSHHEPDWRPLEQITGYLLDMAQNPAIKRFDPVFSTGQRLAFRLRANPTVKRQGKRHGLYQEQDQLAWLERKASSGGFVVNAVWTRDAGTVTGLTAQRHRLKMLAVQFDGVLAVADSQLFLSVLQRGIGPGKGLGFGLLSVAPLA